MRAPDVEGAAPRDDERPPTWALLLVAVVLGCVLVAVERLGVTAR